jgi:hypothetical protein
MAHTTTPGRRAGVLALIVFFSGGSWASARQPAYLADDALRATLVGHTLMGRDWAEYYEKNGTIQGRARYFGIAFDYTGTWTVSGNRACYDYQGSDRDTCSLLVREGDVVRHFTTGGSPKTDDVARRIEGNRIASL